MSEKNVILISKDYIDSNFITSSDERVAVDKTETGYDLALNGNFIERDEYTELKNKVDGNTTGITALEQDVAKKQDDVRLSINNDGNLDLGLMGITQIGGIFTNYFDGFTRFTGVEINGKKPVLDVTSQDGSVIVTRSNDGYGIDLKANGGGGSKMQPCDQVIYDIFPCKNFKTFVPAPYPINLEYNLFCGFPFKGTMELTHIIVPRLLVDRSGYYIGYSKSSVKDGYKQDHKLNDFWAVTTKPCNIENEGESTYIYNVECHARFCTFGDIPVGPEYTDWTGWLDSSKPTFASKIAYYNKSTDENGEDVYTYVADAPADFPLFMCDNEANVWSTSPNFNPDGEYTSTKYPSILIRPSMYPNYCVAVGLRHVFHPDLDWPADHKVATPPTE